MRIGQCDDLAVVTGIGQDFLVPGHGCVEDDFDATSPIEHLYGTVCQGKNCWGPVGSRTAYPIYKSVIKPSYYTSSDPLSPTKLSHFLTASLIIDP